MLVGNQPQVTAGVHAWSAAAALHAFGADRYGVSHFACFPNAIGRTYRSAAAPSMHWPGRCYLLNAPQSTTPCGESLGSGQYVSLQEFGLRGGSTSAPSCGVAEAQHLPPIHVVTAVDHHQQKRGKEYKGRSFNEQLLCRLHSLAQHPELVLARSFTTPQNGMHCVVALSASCTTRLARASASSSWQSNTNPHTNYEHVPQLPLIGIAIQVFQVFLHASSRLS